MSEEFKLESTDISLPVEFTSSDSNMNLNIENAVFVKTIGFYSPEISQPEPDILRVGYTSSDEDMPEISPIDITLPKGEIGVTFKSVICVAQKPKPLIKSINNNINFFMRIILSFK
jgi:hypothetical protein